MLRIKDFFKLKYFLLSIQIYRRQCLTFSSFLISLFSKLNVSNFKWRERKREREGWERGCFREYEAEVERQTEGQRHRETERKTERRHI